MTQERWQELQRKFKPLGVTFNEREFAPVKCLLCSAILDDWIFYCDTCLRITNAGALEWLKAQEAMCLIGKMILLGVSTKTQGYCSPNLAPEFVAYIGEYLKRDYADTGIARNLCFKNPDVVDFFRFCMVGS